MMTQSPPEYTLVEKGLQILSLFAMILTQAGSFLIIPTACAYLVLFTQFRWIVIIYLIWEIFFDKTAPENGKRKSEWVRNWSWWFHAQNYFPVKLVKLQWGELDATRNYMFCYFPHGLLSFGLFFTLASNFTELQEFFPQHKPYIHTISAFYYLPFVRELGMSLGGLKATKKAISHVLAKPEGGNISGLVVGGAAEALNCKPGLHRVVLKKRKGFIKLALMHGSPLVPVYCFGETDLYSQVEFQEGSIFSKMQQTIKNLMGFAAIIPVGRSDSFGILPEKRPLTVVVGEPLDVPKIQNPTQDQIDNLHRKFEESLIALFESEKKNYLKNYEDIHLEIL